MRKLIASGMLLAAALFLCAAAQAQQKDGARAEASAAEARAGASTKGAFPTQLVTPENMNLPANTCFAIRSYIFERHEGEAPRLVGATTCTPASPHQDLARRPLPLNRTPGVYGAVLKELGPAPKP